MDLNAFRQLATSQLGSNFRLFRAPGRVNIIGEHTDYNDGFVLPAAINREILMAAKVRNDRQMVMISADKHQISHYSLDKITHDRQHPWSNYLRGVCAILEDAGFPLRGAEIFFAGDVPLGSGLSSSAALEVVTAITMLSLAGRSLPGEEIARLTQKSENEFVGTRCGIMDMFISALGKAQHALLIDCRSLKSHAVPMPAGIKLIIGDTSVRRGLVDSEYNTRRQQCEEGVATLKQQLPNINALRDVSLKQLIQHQSFLPAMTYQRCHHVVSENDRVLQAVAAMEANDLLKLGQLLNDSHDSLRDDYQVSCNELDIMVEIARQQPGVFGSRMTGAGFGGCTVSLVAEQNADDFVATVARTYQAASGREAQIYVTNIAAGAGEIL